jgi:hypothetical protein
MANNVRRPTNQEAAASVRAIFNARAISHVARKDSLLTLHGREGFIGAPKNYNLIFFFLWLLVWDPAMAYYLT